MTQYTSSQSTIIVFLFTIIMCLCVVALPSRASALTIKGHRHAYSIPHEYTKNTRSIFHYLFKDLKGFDDAPSTFLSIPGADFGVDGGVSVRLMLFYDKLYDRRTIVGASEHILDRSVRIGKQTGFYRYEESFIGEKRHYYFSFDPRLATVLGISDADFYVEMEEGGLVKSGRLNRKALCIIHSVYDGILVQTTVVGVVCRPDNFVKIKTQQDRLIGGWRIED